MSVSKAPSQRVGPPGGSEEAASTRAGQAAPPRDADYGPRLREAEQLVRAGEFRTPPGADAPTPREIGAARLFPSDPKAAILLLNEARYLAVQRAFGVRRDHVNLMTAIAALTIAEAAYAKTARLRRGLRAPTRGDVMLADGVLNALGQEIAGPFAGEKPFFAGLIGAAAVGALATRAVRHTSRDIKAASHRVTLSARNLLASQADFIPRGTR